MKLLPCVGAWLVVAVVLKWYNYVLFSTQLPWFGYLLFSFVWLWMTRSMKWMSKVVGLLFFTVVFSQILSWCNVINLPLFVK